MTTLPFPADDFPVPTPTEAAREPGRGTPRLRVPKRDQIELSWASLEQRLDPDSQARVVWSLVSQLDLEAWLKEIKAIKGHVGRNATDPRLLVALWVFATLRGVGSARELERLCEDHLAYQWLCGGVSVNYHTLADFRSRCGDKWDELLTQIVATLLHEGLVTMDRVAQDGMRVRADAGKSSFRRAGRLEELLEEAKAKVETLKSLAATAADELTRRQRAARRTRGQGTSGAGRERGAGMRRFAEEKAGKRQGQKGEIVRGKSVDHRPRGAVIKFSDGGCRPGFNVQFATDTATGLVVGVDVTNAGTDSEEMPPMLDQLKTRYDIVPDEMLVDGGFASLDAIAATEARDCKVYAPVKDAEKQKKAGKDPYARKPHDTDQTAAWRKRMGEETSRTIYKLRARPRNG